MFRKNVTLFLIKGRVISFPFFWIENLCDEFAVIKFYIHIHMRKITLLLVLNCCFLAHSFGQFEVVGSEEYGRIFGVTYDKTTENKLYAITLGNHILSSTDNGQNWDIFYSIQDGYFNKLENNLKNYGNDKLTFAMRSTTNAARTVSVLNTVSAQIDHQYTAPNPNPGGDTWVSSYSISASDEDYAILSIGYPLGFGAAEMTYYTTDGGATWAVVYDSTQNMDIIPGQVAIHPENPQKLYIARGNGNTDVDGGLLISEDGGATWTEKIAGIVLQPIAFNPTNADEIWVGTGISFGEYPEGLYKSTDGGDTWTEVEIAWTDYLLDCINVIQFNPSNPLNMIILEDNEVAISNDGGTTWDLHVYENALDNPENYAYGLDASFNPFNENEIFISANYYPMFSTNKGETMTRVKTKYFASGGSVNYFNNGEEEHLYYGVQYGFSHRNIETSAETGYEIMPLNFVTNNSGTGAVMDPNKVGRVYTFSGGFMGSSLKMSNNHGENPVEIFSTFSNSLHEVKSVPGNENKVWASFSSFGENAEIYEIDFSDSNNIQSNSLLLPNSSGIVIGFVFGENENSAVAARGSRVHKTTDGGTSWTETSSGLETLHIDNDMIFKIVENPLDANQMSITSNKGIFTTTDGGANWTRIQNSFVHNVKHSTVTNGHIIAATHDSEHSQFGLRYSKDAGANWTEIADEELMFLSSTNVFGSTDFDFHDDLVDVYVSTSGLGLIKFTIDLETMSVIDSDLLAKNSTVIYPNPATNVLNIESKEKVTSVEIIGLSGQKLMNSTAKQINVSHLNKGIYIVKVLLANGKTETHKLVKK